MTGQDFQELRWQRLVAQPVWWHQLTAARMTDGWPTSGDDLGRLARQLKLKASDDVGLSFSKQPHSPRFPTPPFARVPMTDRTKNDYS